jgi:mono/diheme cytochrome c family protein
MKKLAISLTGLILLIATHASAQAPAASFGLCAACHGPDGKGLLAGTPKPMAPPLAGSKFALAGDGEIIASIIFTGIAKEDAKYLGMMAPLGAMMNDEDMATLLTYVRRNFGNNAPAVTATQIKAWREKYNGKPMQKRADLEKLLVEKADATP